MVTILQVILTAIRTDRYSSQQRVFSLEMRSSTKDMPDTTGVLRYIDRTQIKRCLVYSIALSEYVACLMSDMQDCPSDQSVISIEKWLMSGSIFNFCFFFAFYRHFIVLFFNPFLKIGI